MAVLSARKREIVQTVIEAAPDSAIRSLEMALAADTGGGLMGGVRALVESEAADRALRNIVLQPIVPLCGPRGDGALGFPASALGKLWRGLKTLHPEMVQTASLSVGWGRDEGLPPVFDALCAEAAVGLRERDPAFSAIAEADALGLAACLDLAPLVRGLLDKLDVWTNQMTGERAAAARLAYRDAAALADDAGPRFFEMLSAQLSRPWLILRVISAVMDRPAERYLASSELARFGDIVVSGIETLVEQVRAFDPVSGRGPVQGEAEGIAAGKSAEAALVGMAEFDEAVVLSKDGPWGRAVANHKQVLAKLAEARLSALDRLVAAALPLEKPRMGGKGRGTPSLEADPDEAAAERAAGALAFADAVRSASANGGFGAVRAAAIDKVNERLDQYTDELLAHLRDPEAEEPERAKAFLEVAARLVALSQDDKAAQIVRRRTAAA
jgi:hypothetical protein